MKNERGEKNVWDDVSVCFLWRVAGLAEGDLKKGVTLVSFLHWLPSTRFLLERREFYFCVNTC